MYPQRTVLPTGRNRRWIFCGFCDTINAKIISVAKREMHMKEVIEHYNKLIEENNDPARDPEPLRDYMDKWDGEKFIDSMQLDKSKSVLEIGIGTGRLAIKIAPNCKSLCGIDISEKTIGRAAENLSIYQNINLICGDFTSFEFEEQFDVIYSSLTFMHIQDKLSAIQKIAALLTNKGVFVLSIDKTENDHIDMGDRKIKIYPDNPNDIRSYLSISKLKIINEFETDHAYVTVSTKASLV